MEKNYAQIFNEIAKESHDAFRDKLGELVVFLTSSPEKQIYTAPEIAERLRRAIPERMTRTGLPMENIIRQLTNELRAANAAALAGRQRALKGLPVDLIALDDKTREGGFSGKFTQEMELVLNLEHEIGHLVLAHGFAASDSAADKQLAESAASAYAILLHVRHFGTDTDRVGAYAESKAVGIILSEDTSHYVSDAVERAFRLTEREDLSSLSLPGIAAYADRIAVESRTTDATLKKINDAYLPVRDAYKAYKATAAENGGRKFYDDPKAAAIITRAIKAVMAAHPDDADVLKAGQRFLDYPPVKKAMAKPAVSPIPSPK